MVPAFASNFKYNSWLTLHLVHILYHIYDELKLLPFQKLQCSTKLHLTQLQKYIHASTPLFLMPVKSILTEDINIVCLYQLLLVKTAIATGIEILNI